MKFHRSRVGRALALLYCVLAGYVAASEYRCDTVSFVRCDIGIALVTFPAVYLLYGLLGLPEYDFREPTPNDVLQVVLLIALCAALVYLVGYAIEAAYRFLKRVMTQTPR